MIISYETIKYLEPETEKKLVYNKDSSFKIEITFSQDKISFKIKKKYLKKEREFITLFLYKEEGRNDIYTLNKAINLIKESGDAVLSFNNFLSDLEKATPPPLEE